MGDLSWVLLVEDEEDHRVLMREALDRSGVRVPLLEAESGEEAMEWMDRQVARVGPLTRGLVILDLGLPGISGFDVLQRMREVPGLQETPVVVITASENAMDRDHAFNLGARGFFQKPTDFRHYQDILQRVMALKPAAGSATEPT